MKWTLWSSVDHPLKSVEASCAPRVGPSTSEPPWVRIQSGSDLVFLGAPCKCSNRDEFFAPLLTEY